MADGVRAFLAALTRELSDRGKADPGLVPFALQTAVLDALVWPAFYPR